MIWIVVVNVSDPDTVVTIDGIEVQILNENFFLDQDMTYRVTNIDMEDVTVTLKGPRSVLEDLTANDFVITANLKNYDSVAGSVPLDISLSSTYSRYQDEIEYLSRPYSAWLELENITEVQYTVEVNVTGNLSEGYIQGDAVFSTTQVTVKAPESTHNLIRTVRVTVNVGGATSDVTVTGQTPLLYDSSGNAIKTSSEVTVLTQVDVTIPIYYTKTVPVYVTLEGECADEAEMTGYSLSMEEVMIYGEKTVLDTIDSVSITGSAVSVEGISESTELTVSVNDYLPSGVAVYGEEYETLTVSVTVEGIEQRTVTIEKTDIMYLNSPTGYLISFANDDDVTVVLKGLQEDLDALNEDTLNPYVDLSDLTAGSHAVALNLTLPDGLTFQDDVYIVVEITETTETMEVTIAKSSIEIRNASDDYEVAFEDNDSETVILEGLQDDLDALDVSTLDPYVDLSGLGVGRNAVELEVTLPDGITMQGTAYVIVVISEPETTTQEITETETTTAEEEETTE